MSFQFLRSWLGVALVLILALGIIAYLGGARSSADTWDRFVWGALFGSFLTVLSMVIKHAFFVDQRRHEVLLPQKAEAVVEILEAARGVRGAWIEYRRRGLSASSLEILMSEFLPQMLTQTQSLQSLGWRYRPLIPGVDSTTQTFLSALTREKPPKTAEALDAYEAAVQKCFQQLESDLNRLLTG